MPIDVILSYEASTIYTQKMHQYDKGVVLNLIGVELPEVFEAHFSNDPDDGVSAMALGADHQVKIPDAYFQTGKFVYVWIYLKETENSGISSYKIIIPVEPRPAVLDMKQISTNIGASLDEENHTLIFG